MSKIKYNISVSDFDSSLESIRGSILSFLLKKELVDMDVSYSTNSGNRTVEKDLFKDDIFKDYECSIFVSRSSYNYYINVILYKKDCLYINYHFSFYFSENKKVNPNDLPIPQNIDELLELFNILKDYNPHLINIFSKYNKEHKDEFNYLLDLEKKYCVKLKEKKKAKVYTIGSRGNSFYLIDSDIDRKFKMSKEELNLHYGENFNKKYKKLVKEFDNRDGLILLHGTPGTGKTSLIKNLISKIDKKFIYLPTYMIQNLSSPEFITFLTTLNQDIGNFVIIIEEAEDALRKRSEGKNPYISNILNISNGILNDIIKAQIICTFNTDMDNIDEALTRAGRLRFEHKFSKLNVEESNKLLNKLGKENTDKDLTVSEIYNKKVKMEKVNKEVRKIGFKN